MKYIDTKDDASEPGFYEIQSAFQFYSSGKDITSVKGWKQYKRWEEFIEPRVYPSGYLPRDIIWTEYQKKKSSPADKATVANWTHLGPDNVPTQIVYGTKRGVGRINCVAFHPANPDIFWVGAPSGGLWKTTDGGSTWATTTDDLPSIGISDIAVHPSNPDIIYIATGDGDASDTYTVGVLMSTDGGATFSTTGLNWTVDNNRIIRRLIINPDNPDILIAATKAGIYRTTDAGVNWTNVQTGRFKDLEFKPGDPSVVYAARYADVDVYKSTDSGNSFSVITPVGLTTSDTYRCELTVTPANPSVIYAVFSNWDDDGFHSLYKSTNSGTSWTKTIDASSVNLLGWESDGSDSGGQGWYDLAMVVSPSNANTVYVGGVNLWKSTDGGYSFNINAHWWGDGTEYVHADHHWLSYSPSGILYSGNDGGLYKTSDGGNNWIDISDHIHILQIYRLGVSQTNENIVITGSQDNGTMKYNTGTWNGVIGGDGMECVIDFNNENIMYGSVYYGQIRKSTNGGNNFNDISPASDGAWITPYLMHPTNSSILFAGYDEVYKTTTGGSSWFTISSGLTGGENLRSIAVAPSDPDYIYAATYLNIWMTTTGGGSWSEITTGLPGQYIKYITVSDADPDKLWITFSGYTAGEKVYSSSDGGSSWTNFSTGLPNLPVNCIVFENGSNDALYCGTDLGVYYTDNSLTEWTDFNDGLPNVIVNELEIQYDSGKIRAATYGRGLWESDLYTPASTPDVSLLMFDNQSCNGDCDGYIMIAVSGGISPYSFLWSNGATDQNLFNLCEDEYTVTVTDQAAATGTLTQTITEPDEIEVTIDSQTDPSAPGNCDGTASLSAVGGDGGPYTYSWSDGGTGAARNDLCEGTYTITLQDANGCTDITSVTLTDPLTITVVSQNNPACNGDCNGSVTIAVDGGNAPYLYLWQSGGNGETESGLCAGTYTVTVTDFSLSTTTSSVILTEPDLLILTATDINYPSLPGLCDGSITVDASGGTSPYTFDWSNGGTGITQESLCTDTYSITVTDANSCQADITVSLDNQFSASVILYNDVYCIGECDGGAIASGYGGTPPYSYIWSDGATDSIRSDLCLGIYTVTVTDATLETTTSSVTISEPAIISFTGDTTVCFGTQLVLSVQATGGGLGYIWQKDGSDIILGMYQDYTIGEIDSLHNGIYQCVVSNGCYIDTAGPFTVTVNRYYITAHPADVSVCEGGTAVFDITVTGLDVNYQWQKDGIVISGATDSILTLENVEYPDIGGYSCIITGSCGTLVSNPGYLSLDSLELTGQPADTSVCEGSDAILSVSATGSGISYQWRKDGIAIPGAN
ncbi:MAG: hypothetical protein KJ607_11935, partial [Bacteroidetes bacterium]|nr:hypothetical protein [Bacteroidota bacterium]